MLAQGGNEALKGAREHSLAHGSRHFVARHARIAGQKTPEAAVREGVDRFARVHAGPAIPLARQREHRIRAALHATPDHAREMHPEKRESRIRNRVDEVAHQRRAGHQLEVVPAKGHDPRGRPFARHGGDAIGMEPGARNEVVGTHLEVGCPHDPPACLRTDRDNVRVGVDGGAECNELSLERSHDAAKVDDSLVGHAHGCDTADVGFDFLRRLRREPFEAAHAVCGPALEERAQARGLRVVQSDDEFATVLVRHAVLGAVGRHRADPANGQSGLRRAWCVVETAVEHA